MKQLTAYTLFLMAGLSFNTAISQNSDATRPWTITDCIKYASGHNIHVATLRLNQESSAQDLASAKGQRIPNLSASLNNVFTHAKNTVTAGDGLVNQLTTSGTYSINSSVVLWKGDFINNNIRIAELQTQSAVLSVQQSLNNITLLITLNFLNVLLAKENLKYINDLAATSQAIVKQGQLFYNAGSIAKKDLLQLQAQLAGDRYLLVQAQNMIRQNILTLEQSLQLPADSVFDIAAPDIDIVPSSLTPLFEVKQEALQNFPDIKIGRLGVDIASLDIARAKAGFKPTLSANGLLASGYSDVLINSKSSKTSYFSQTGNNFFQQAGLTLSIPVFSNRINKTSLAKAKIAYSVAKLELQNDQLILMQAVEQSYLDASNALQSFEAANIQLQAATESYRIANAQFSLGSINVYDLLQQRNQYVQAVQAFTQSKYTAVLQQKIYEFYAGRTITL